MRKNEKRDSKSVSHGISQSSSDSKLDSSSVDQKNTETSSPIPTTTSTTSTTTVHMQTTPMTINDHATIDTNNNYKEINLEKNENVGSSIPVTTTSFSIESIQTELNNLLSETLELSLQTVAGTTASTTTTTTTSTSQSQPPASPPTSTISTSTVAPTQTSTITPVPVNGKIQFNGKDDNLTSLNNRIKILELNMSLSSQYLEKLSQHYRLGIRHV